MSIAMATSSPSHRGFAPPNYPQSQATGLPFPPVVANLVISDDICLQIYRDLVSKAGGSFLPTGNVLRPVILADPRTMTIGDLFSVAVSQNLVSKAGRILKSPKMQEMFQAGTFVNPHYLRVFDNRFNADLSLLGWASQFGSLDMLHTLYNTEIVEQRVFDVNYVDMNNHTPLECAFGDVGQSRRDKVDFFLRQPGIEASTKRATTLQKAIWYGGDWLIVEKLLAKGADVNTTGGDFGSCLEAACFFASSEIVFELISRSSSDVLNSGGARYGSALQAASCLGRPDVVERLLTSGKVKVNQIGGIYGCALSAAAKGSCIDVRDPYTTDPRTRHRWDAFTRTKDVSQLYLELVQVLLKHGAAVDHTAAGIFYNTLCAAIHSNHPPILEELLKTLSNSKIDRDVLDDIYAEALVEAASAWPTPTSSRFRMFDLLIEMGTTNLDRCSSRWPGRYPLETAAQFGHLAHVKYLVDHGAKVSLKEGHLGGPIRAALIYSSTNRQSAASIAQHLLGKVNIRSPEFTAGDSQYCNVLHLAVYYGVWDTAKHLLENGADCKVKDSGKRSVLHVATLGGEPEAVKMLLDGNYLDAEIIEGEDAWGKTALQLAEEESKKTQELLEKTPRDPPQNIYSPWQPHSNPTRELLNYKAGQWTNILQIFEQQATKDRERQDDTGYWISGPKSKMEQAELKLARSVVTTLARASGSGFQATIVDFSTDANYKYESHKIKNPYIDEILYTSSLHDIMTRQNAPAITFDQENRSMGSTELSSQRVAEVNPGTNQEYRDTALRWVNLPANNMAWVEDLANNIRQRQSNPAPPVSKELWGVDLQSTSSHSALHTYSITPQCRLLTLDHRPSNPTVDESKEKYPFFLCLPYIHWESIQGQEDTRLVLEEGEPLNGKDPSDELLRRFVKNIPPLHIRRSLDQYYYSKLKDTRARDKDQVVNRARDEDLKFRHLTMREGGFEGWIADRDRTELQILKIEPQSDDEDREAANLTEAIKQLAKLENKIYQSTSRIKDEHIRISLQASMRDSPIIMVDQLWLWVLDSDTMISSFSPKRQCQLGTGLDPKNTTDIMKTITKHLRTTTRPPVRDYKDLTNLIVSQCLGILLDHKNRLEELDFLTTFSTQTASVLDKAAKLLNMFVKSIEQYGNQSEVPGSVFEIMFSVTKETLLFREVQDIRDELGMLSALFQEQIDVLADAEKLLYPEETKKEEDTALGLSRARVLKHQKDVARMEGQAVQAYEMLKDLLDLKQQQANVLEARQSRKQAVIAAKQGKVVLVFTVVTIVFLPLTFMTTIFTLNVSTFPKKVIPATDVLQASTTLEGKYVFPLIVGVTIAMAVPLVFIAFKVELMSAWVSRSALYKRFFEKDNEE